MQICLFGHWSDVPRWHADVTCWLILITSTSTAVCDDDDDDDDDDDISAHLYCIWSTTQWLCYAANRACTNCEGSTSGCKVVWCPNIQSFQTCKLEESLEMLSRCTQQTYLGRGSHWGDRLLRLTQLTWVGVGGHWGDRFKKAQPGTPSKSLPPYNWGLWNFSCVRIDNTYKNISCPCITHDLSCFLLPFLSWCLFFVCYFVLPFMANIFDLI